MGKLVPIPLKLRGRRKEFSYISMFNPNRYKVGDIIKLYNGDTLKVIEGELDLESGGTSYYCKNFPGEGSVEKYQCYFLWKGEEEICKRCSSSHSGLVYIKI